MIACLFLTMGCVLITGRDKDRLDEGTVMADAQYKIAKERFASGGVISDDVILEWLNSHRRLFAFIVGATEGKTADEVLKELDKDSP